MCEYEPYGKAWREVLKRNKKDSLITLYANVCREVIELRKKNEELNKAYESLKFIGGKQS